MACPNTRPRCALVAVNLQKVELLAPVHKWKPALEKMSMAVPPSKIVDFLFPDDAQEVQLAELKLSMHAAARNSCHK